MICTLRFLHNNSTFNDFNQTFFHIFFWYLSSSFKSCLHNIITNDSPQELPSINQDWATIRSNNDGTQPAEPGQRGSQIILEGFLKKKCLAEPLITTHFGYKFAGLSEDDEGVTATFLDLNNQEQKIRAAYLVGADGGQSRVRKAAGIVMEGRPLPFAFFLVHFRSKALTELAPLGTFWHGIPLHMGFIIDQDGIDTYTVHQTCPTDASAIAALEANPVEVIYSVLGGIGAPLRIPIDTVLVANAWRPNFALADTYTSNSGAGKAGRILLGGDAAHRNPPYGGYGMNSGVEDAIAMAWRLGSLYKGVGGPGLVESYTEERRPAMMMRLEACDGHLADKYAPLMGKVTEMEKKGEVGVLLDEGEEGEKARGELRKHLDTVGSECVDRGVELDARYWNSPVIVGDGTVECGWRRKGYTPTTRPGHRAPHVFLADGETSVLDLLGPEWTLIDFEGVGGKQAGEGVAEMFVAVAKEMGVELKHVRVGQGETHVKKVWEDYDFVLVRADSFVVWRGGKSGARDESRELDTPRVKEIWQIVLGWKANPGYVKAPKKELRLRTIQGVREEVGAGEGQGDKFEGFYKDEKLEEREERAAS